MSRIDKQILVVDDQKSMRDLAALHLKEIGFVNVDDAEDAWTALQMMSKKKYDIVILDWNMAGMSGLELVRTLRKVPELNSIRIVMATSVKGMDQMREAFDAGANQYVTKPYNAHDLRRRIQAVLQ